MRVTIYVGSGSMGNIDEQYLGRVHLILKKYFRSYTIQKSIGVWEDQQEESIEIIVLIHNLVLKELEACIDELKQALNQEKIIYIVEVVPWEER